MFAHTQYVQNESKCAPLHFISQYKVSYSTVLMPVADF